MARRHWIRLWLFPSAPFRVAFAALQQVTFEAAFAKLILILSNICSNKNPDFESQPPVSRVQEKWHQRLASMCMFAKKIRLLKELQEYLPRYLVGSPGSRYLRFKDPARCHPTNPTAHGSWITLLYIIPLQHETPELHFPRMYCNSSSARSHDRSPNPKDLRDIQPFVIIRHMLPGSNAKHFHPPVIPKACEQLWRDQKVLTGILLASNFNHTFMNHTLVARIHALIDFVDYTERCSCHFLKGHEVENGRYWTLASGLSVLIEDL